MQVKATLHRLGKVVAEVTFEWPYKTMPVVLRHGDKLYVKGNHRHGGYGMAAAYYYEAACYDTGELFHGQPVEGFGQPPGAALSE